MANGICRTGAEHLDDAYWRVVAERAVMQPDVVDDREEVVLRASHSVEQGNAVLKWIGLNGGWGASNPLRDELGLRRAARPHGSRKGDLIDGRCELI